MMHVCLLLAVLTLLNRVVAQDLACTAHIPLGNDARQYFEAWLKPKPYISVQFVDGDDPLLTARSFCGVQITGNGPLDKCVEQIMVSPAFESFKFILLVGGTCSNSPSHCLITPINSVCTVTACLANHATRSGSVACNQRRTANNVLQLR
jgi:hypothetical protein